MKALTLTGLVALLLLGLVGCSTDKDAPTAGEPMDYNVIGDDSPADVATALAELSALEIEVPDPVLAEDPALSQEVDLTAAAEIIRGAALDDEGRVMFRRIVGHLHDQFQLLRRCMNQNEDPRLRRLAFGAAHAYQRGMRALQAGEPRMALRYFHQANRVLNLAIGICRGDDGGRP